MAAGAATFSAGLSATAGAGLAAAVASGGAGVLFSAGFGSASVLAGRAGAAHASIDSSRTCSLCLCRSAGGSAITAKNGRLPPGGTRRSASLRMSSLVSFSTSTGERSPKTSSADGSVPASASERDSMPVSVTSSATTRIGPRTFLLRFSTRPRTKKMGLPEAVS